MAEDIATLIIVALFVSQFGLQLATYRRLSAMSRILSTVCREHQINHGGPPINEDGL